MGPTGSGKSTVSLLEFTSRFISSSLGHLLLTALTLGRQFINLATQSPNKLQVGRSRSPCTDTVERADPFDLEGRRVVLFDTPGFDDTNMTETEILRIIALELEKQYRKGQTLHGIIYVHRISDFYVNGLAKTNLGTFRKLCGDSSLQNVVIMTNMWSRLHSEPEGRRRAAELASTDDFFKPAIAEGAVMVHHMQSTVESARTMIRQVLKNHPIVLNAHEEIVDQHESINETGMGFDEKLAQLELKQLEAAEQARKEQLKQAERIRQLQETLDEEKRNQARQYQLLQEQFADAERKREQAIREVEERSRREIQAAEARWRQEVEEAEQRRVKEKTDLEERMKNMTMTPNDPSPSFRDGVIVSGRSYAMFNQKYESYYATLDHNEEHLIMEPRLGQERARQQTVEILQRRQDRAVHVMENSISEQRQVLVLLRQMGAQGVQNFTPILMVHS
ncbi:hypothetical protein EST38_g6933 [Candolleomyces aberdarensis]|uniref:G domain-containing protein n=1 Tax=Candolleomyces aberdarensis TaxID=2316362 RepID=A0A4Q2DGM3_9AGAR|nr:hypothetical protein EST38_g6933 [Candolleomyces aberdarensis]